ncbi:MAG: methyltransferase domain-containing protein [Steroidobacteraceae bacterium]
MKVPYNERFYQTYRTESLRSARRVVPIALNFVQPRSVVDIGCGIGTWLSVFSEFGVSDLVGMDGDYLPRGQLLIRPEQFTPVNLSDPPHVGRRFDLAISLEVAEHLPAARADSFLKFLVSLAPVVMFSAAIPHQGGDGHCNEQWPEYWAERFAAQDYVAYDCFRPLLWMDDDIAYYYAQNLFLFVDRDHVGKLPGLADHRPANGPLSRVHPRRWLEANDPRRQRLPYVLRALPHSIGRATGTRLRRWLIPEVRS